MFKSVKSVVSVLFVSMLATGVAQAADGDGDPKAGKDKSGMCQGCHGETGVGMAPNFPHLAGQYQKYIERQMRDYQTSKRVDPMMTGMAAGVTDPQDLKDIAAYFSSQKRVAGNPGGDKELLAKGRKIYFEGNMETGVYACSNCHGEKGDGKDTKNNVFPVISGQSKDYLLKQMNDFKSGERRNDPAGMMSAIVKKMTDAEINAVVEFSAGM
ncbi:MAG: cytochrome c class I [Gallionellaceae bacterium]|nr:MAG: cytochrome c class I [Gallionellaceae bacterium]